MGRIFSAAGAGGYVLFSTLFVSDDGSRRWEVDGSHCGVAGVA